MSKSIIMAASMLSVLSLTLSACGTRHNRNVNGKKPVMTMFGKTDLQLQKTLKDAWGTEWDVNDPKSQELANKISGVGVVTNSRVGEMENVTVTIVHGVCHTEDVVLNQTIKPGPEVQSMEVPLQAQGPKDGVEKTGTNVSVPPMAQYKVQIKCISADKSCNEYTLLISKTDAENKPAGSVAVYVQQNANDFKKAGDEVSANEHSQVWWVKKNAQPMSASKAKSAKELTCNTKVEEEKKTEEPPMHSEGE